VAGRGWQPQVVVDDVFALPQLDLPGGLDRFDAVFEHVLVDAASDVRVLGRGGRTCGRR
jgi:hypothetical protein